MSREAMKQALEALENLPALNWIPEKDKQVQEAITALRRALEQADEPVAFQIFKPTSPRHAIPSVRDAELPWVYDQDPSSGNVASMWVTPVARPQPAVQWQGLKASEYAAFYNQFAKYQEENADVSGWWAFAEAIEQALKKKNIGETK